MEKQMKRLMKQRDKAWKDRNKNGGFYPNGLKRLTVWRGLDYVYNQLKSVNP